MAASIPQWPSSSPHQAHALLVVSRRLNRRRVLRVAIPTVVATVLAPLSLIAVAPPQVALATDTVVGIWTVSYGDTIPVNITGTPSLYTVTTMAPTRLGSGDIASSSCYLPAGTVTATFAGSPPTFSGSHGLWYNSDCSFGYWDTTSFALSPDGSTLTATLGGGYGTDTFTKVPTNSYSAAVVADNPISYWPLTDPSGSTTAVDLRGSTTGFLQGGVTAAAVPGPVSGTTAMSFDGSNCSGISLDSGAASLAPTTMTVEAWARSSSTSGGILFRWRDFGYGLYPDDFGLYPNGSGASAFVNANPTSDGNWHYLVGTYDGNSIDLYIDGALAASTPGSGSPFYGGANQVAIGRDADACDGIVPSFSGDIGQVAVYGYALSATQVAAHYAAAANNLLTTPSAPTNVSVIPQNGSAVVSWSPPTSDGGSPVSGYLVTATPVYNDRLPAPNLGSVQVAVGPAIRGWTVEGLTADCHELYKVSVAAMNSNGTGAPAQYSHPVRPSGFLTPGVAPATVVILLDGFLESKDGFQMNPFGPTNDPPLPGGRVQGYCPESYDSQALLPNYGSETEADFAGTPIGPWQFFNKWNFADPGGEQGSNSTPRLLASEFQMPTHSFMLDALAGQGAIFLPFSYKGATLGGTSSNPTFQFSAYTWCDATPIPRCGSIARDVSWLDKEVRSIHAIWPHARIVVIGHSQGGLIAFDWWINHGLGGRTSVTNLFALDSPINGVCTSILCLGPVGYPSYGLRDTLDPAYLQLDAAMGNPFRFVGTWGDTVPIPPFFGAYGPAGAENLQHELLVTGSNCDLGVSTDCPAPPDHVSGCPIFASSPQWVQDDQHFITKFCPENVAYVNGVLHLSY